MEFLNLSEALADLGHLAIGPSGLPKKHPELAVGLLETGTAHSQHFPLYILFHLRERERESVCVCECACVCVCVCMI